MLYENKIKNAGKWRDFCIISKVLVSRPWEMFTFTKMGGLDYRRKIYTG